MSEEKKTEYLNIHKNFIKEGLENKETKQKFNVVNLPQDTFIGDKNVGGYQFKPLYVNLPPKFDENNQPIRDENGKFVLDENSPMRSIPLVQDRKVWLQKDDDTVKVTPEELKSALIDGRKNYIENKKNNINDVTSKHKKTTYIYVHKNFVAENLKNKETNKEFNVVTLPSNTVVSVGHGVVPVGGYQFKPLYVNLPPKFDENNQPIRDENGKFVLDENSPMRSIPLVQDRKVWLQKDDDTVKVTPEELKSALKICRKDYLDIKAENREVLNEIKENQDIPFEIDDEHQQPLSKEQKKAMLEEKKKDPQESIAYHSEKVAQGNETREKPIKTQGKGLGK